MNDWHFTGRVIDVSPKTTKSGKPFAEVVIGAAMDSERPEICVCTWWHDKTPAIGTAVVASGTIRGREYQGKHYAGLDAEEIERLDVDRSTAVSPPARPVAAQPDAKQPDLTPAQTAADREIPF